MFGENIEPQVEKMPISALELLELDKVPREQPYTNGYSVYNYQLLDK